jgi:hypothetical protein
LGDKIDALKQNNGNCSIVYVLRQPFRKETNSRYNNNDMKYKEDIELELKDIST